MDGFADLLNAVVRDLLEEATELRALRDTADRSETPTPTH